MSDEEPSSTSEQPQGSKYDLFVQHVKANKVDVALWTTRLLTIVFTLSYILGIQASAFNKVLLANVATSALRLHQRLPTFALSREFLAKFLVEDSCHYFLFSLIFVNSHPTFLILVPILLFAILHASSYSLKLLDLVRINGLDLFARFFISIVEFQTVNILRGAAFSEIFLMPMTVIWTFMGRAGLMTPVLYYYFLHMRYESRRNPYTRDAFSHLRIRAESFAERSPPFVKNILHKSIAIVCRLAPQPPQL